MGNYGAELSREWLIGNGLGGYSSSTVLGINTRKYHGLLVAPTEEPPFGRKLLLSKMEESLSGGTTAPLSANEYPGVVHPGGHANLKQFRLDPLPTFLYRLPDILVKKTVFMPHGHNAVVVNYRVWNPAKKSIKMVVSPIINFRSIHSLTKAGAVDFKQRTDGKKVEVTADGQLSLSMASDLMDFHPSQLPEKSRWYKNFVYRRERERGYEFVEDQYCPGSFEFSFDGDSEFNILAAGGYGGGESFWSLYRQPHRFDRLKIEAIRRLDELAKKGPQESWGGYLSCAADSFLTGGRVIAGYHWFGCWGRDTLISLPGLALVTGRHDEARKVLLDLAARRGGGVIPNWFESGEAGYECIDASLMYIYALHKYLAYTDDLKTAKELWTPGLEILEGCVRGRAKGVRVEEDGLLWSDRTTWMDARVDEKRVTPRSGKAVEINAFWYNALRSMEGIGGRIGKPFKLSGLADKAKKNFLQTFWNGEKNCLYDAVDGDSKDGRLRPNQIFAVGLPFPVLEGEKARLVLQAVEERLLTPFGLRSLAKDEPGYIGKYGGGQWDRDMAYHQGTVWSWLIGPFITAYVRLTGSSKKAEGLLENLVGGHLKEAGLGTVSEIFDGDEPHLPGGCISQAWSVGEIIRCYSENIKGIKPPFESKYGVK
ncbi:MAG: amylo-alpha-1,6-glucosidase [Candidatus Hadarchaeota archaeon]